MNTIRIAAADIPEREGRVVRVGARSLAVFNLGGRFLAVDNRCPHGGGPLADGIVSGNTVTCPLHNWRVDLESGQVVKPCASHRGGVATFEVTVEDGIVLVQLGEESVAA